MKKLFTVALILLTAHYTKAQTLTDLIPENVFAVGSVKGDHLLKLTEVANFDQSFLGQKLMKQMSESKDKTYSSIGDLGVKLDEASYYFSILTDSINYNCYLVPLADATAFKQFITAGEGNLSTANGLNTFVLKDSSAVIKWDNQKALYLDGDISYSFLNKDGNSERYGLSKVEMPYRRSYAAPVVGDYTETMVDDAEEASDAVMVDTVMAAEVATDVVMVESVKVPSASTKRDAPTNAAVEIKQVPDYEQNSEKVVTESIAPPPPPPLPPYNSDDVVEVVAEAVPYDAESDEKYDSEMDAYNKGYAANEAIKKRIQMSWLNNQSSYIFAGGFKSIKNNSTYAKSINNKAVASVWVSNLQTIYSNLLTGFTGFSRMDAFNGFGQLNLDVFLDNEKMRVESKMTLDKSVAASYRKMMSRKINRKFFKYVDSDKTLGFASYAVDTKAYLEEFPKLLDRTYSGFLGEFGDLAGVGTDLFSLLLDEEAVAKVIKGDALFLINGVNTKEVKYTSYDYDDDYKRTEVEKTKTETMPSFLMMFSSDDYKLLTKLLNLNSAKNYVTQQDGFYTVSYRKSPFDFYVMMKKGVVFVGNSLPDFQQISRNQYHVSISKKHKKILKNSNFSMVVNPKVMAEKLPLEEIGSGKQKEFLKTTLAEMNDIYIKSNRIKGNVISGEMVAEIPSGQKNALEYILSLIEKAVKL